MQSRHSSVFAFVEKSCSLLKHADCTRPAADCLKVVSWEDMHPKDGVKQDNAESVTTSNIPEATFAYKQMWACIANARSNTNCVWVVASHRYKHDMRRLFRCPQSSQSLFRNDANDRHSTRGGNLSEASCGVPCGCHHQDARCRLVSPLECCDCLVFLECACLHECSSLRPEAVETHI